jgi:hypothetical protein
MGNNLKKYFCPVDVETRTFLPCRTTNHLASPYLAPPWNMNMVPPLDVVQPLDSPYLDSPYLDYPMRMYLSKYEARCIEAAIRAHKADRALENDVEIFNSEIIVNV